MLNQSAENLLRIELFSDLRPQHSDYFKSDNNSINVRTTTRQKQGLEGCSARAALKRPKPKKLLYPKIISVRPISHAKEFLKYVLYFQTFLQELQMAPIIPILRNGV